MTTPDAVIDEDAFTDLRGRVDLDLREKARDVREKARQNRNAGAIQRVIDPMREQRVEARVREHDVQPAASRRIAFEGRSQVGEDVSEGHLQQCNPLVNQRLRQRCAHLAGSSSATA